MLITDQPNKPNEKTRIVFQSRPGHRLLSPILQFPPIIHTNWPRVKTALRPPPSAQAENEFSALFPGKRAEIYFPPPFRPFWILGNFRPFFVASDGSEISALFPGKRAEKLIFCLGGGRKAEGGIYPGPICLL